MNFKGLKVTIGTSLFSIICFSVSMNAYGERINDTNGPGLAYIGKERSSELMPKESKVPEVVSQLKEPVQSAEKEFQVLVDKRLVELKNQYKTYPEANQALKNFLNAFSKSDDRPTKSQLIDIVAFLQLEREMRIHEKYNGK